jgi:hypothetical protein
MKTLYTNKKKSNLKDQIRTLRVDYAWVEIVGTTKVVNSSNFAKVRLVSFENMRCDLHCNQNVSNTNSCIHGLAHPFFNFMQCEKIMGVATTSLQWKIALHLYPPIFPHHLI